MHHYTIIAITLVVLGFALFFFLDTFISPSTEQSMLKTIRDQHMLIGGAALLSAYYMYTLSESESVVQQQYMSETLSDVPSYEDATSDILKM